MNAVHYRIIPSSPEAHIFEVTCTVNAPDPAGQILSLPAWIPGSYMIRDFSKNIVSINATTNGDKVAIDTIDKQTWRCAPCDATLVITCQIYAWDLSVRSAHLDTTHGYFNGTSMFLSVQGQEHLPCSVEILAPAGDRYRNWKVSTAMSLDGAQTHGFGQYCAQDYDELIDHPVEMGDFTLATFDVAGVPHDIAITGKHRADMDRLCRDLKIICEHHVALFGELPAMDRYVFQVMATGDGYGGLEHRASTSLLCSRYDLPLAGNDKVSEQYRSFLGLCSHEYFHTWNVKRIKPDVFIPYDLRDETYTHLMWMFEGITSYYDDLSLIRTKLIEADSYLELLAQNITRIQRGSGRLKQSVWDSSFYTWNKFYKQDENAPNAIVSYYGKGALLAMGLDLIIRKHSQQEKSLDDVMRYLWSEYGKKGIGVNEVSIEQEIIELTGVDLKDFFERYLRGIEELPLQKWLQEQGVDVEFRTPQSSQDKGGKKPDSADEKVNFGIRFTNKTEGVTLTHVLDNGAAQIAGMSAGDVVLAMDGIRVDAKTFDQRIAEYKTDDRVEITAFRRDELMSFTLAVIEPEADTCVLTIQSKIPEWLSD